VDTEKPRLPRSIVAVDDHEGIGRKIEGAYDVGRGAPGATVMNIDVPIAASLPIF